ncbi:TLP18.3/Psb32/MOLO-1 phosphatase superfamily protein [Pontibacter ummariensis]|uniref:TLP18.3, Psb32 and MOLO-1 founding protein of phosphatase n=1 Tax=Pontibacter ummariensis TaxID=1610492 RepID=A0A239CT28_9BACT|nr:TPM domain-containing protein [Pontibacter ummariensis]PRY14854.1 TLP18.3/Psb32/MOLO-1 phosphatase superfamily protein [Pontibacter ummariensis]SNS23022.1 TLP18.3, Psb32 and MOLO-1 founding protein of phosphatase [Pontibacter ummariensis]
MPRDTITPADEQQIMAAIQEAETNTSGEIRVHIESNCEGDVLDRATEVFAELNMHHTKLRNGVLFYVALEDHQFAVLGDAGINAIVPDHFWEDITAEVIKHFKQKKYAAGLAKGVLMAGEQLKAHFPYNERGDINELSDDISFGD